MNREPLNYNNQQMQALVSIFNELPADLRVVNAVIRLLFISYYRNLARKKGISQLQLQQKLNQMVSIILLTMSLVGLFFFIPNVNHNNGVNHNNVAQEIVYPFAVTKYNMVMVAAHDSADPNWVSSLKLSEGFRSKAYYDVVGKCSSRGCWTIGFGHCIDKMCGSNKADAERLIGRRITDKTILTRNEAEKILHHDIGIARSQAKKYLPFISTLSNKQKETIIELVFNGGAAGVLKLRSMIKHLKNGEGGKAANAFSGYLWCKQVGKLRCNKYKEGLNSN